MHMSHHDYYVMIFILRNHYVIGENTRMSHHRSLNFFESFRLLRNDDVIVFVLRYHYVAGKNIRMSQHRSLNFFYSLL